MPQDPPFEIPQELRQLAEENVERARQLYLQFMDGVSKTIWDRLLIKSAVNAATHEMCPVTL